MSANLSKRLFHTAISLTNTQPWLSRWIPVAEMIPHITTPRFRNGGLFSETEASSIIAEIPSLSSRPWSEYFADVGRRYEKEGRTRAACMSYIMGSFPKEQTPWREELNELKRQAFRRWCDEQGFAFEERILTTPYGWVRYYLHLPEVKAGEKIPLAIFMNGSDASAEEIAFSLEHHRAERMAFVLMSVVGGVDYSFPMVADSHRVVSWVLDDLLQNPQFDRSRVGMFGFSFGGYWTLISAKTDHRIRFSMVNGIPLRHTFRVGSRVGLNPIISSSLCSLFGVKHPLELLKKIRQLSDQGDRVLGMPSGPILAINGDRDTIVDVRDTVLVGKQPGNRLVLIRNEDHCGLLKFNRMVALMVAWARKHRRIPPEW